MASDSAVTDHPKWFTWKGHDIGNVGQLVTALYQLKSREEAEQFVNIYAAVEPAAAINIGYCAGYIADAEQRARVLDWCRTTHPIFGNEFPDA